MLSQRYNLSVSQHSPEGAVVGDLLYGGVVSALFKENDTAVRTMAGRIHFICTPVKKTLRPSSIWLMRFTCHVAVNTPRGSHSKKSGIDS